MIRVAVTARARRFAFAALAVLVPFSMTNGCSDRIVTGTGRVTPPDSVGSLPDNVGSLVVSDPIPGPAAAPGSARTEFARSTGRGAGGETVVYVSLAPGTIEDGVRASITDLASGRSVTTGLVSGGFDPAPLVANDGDSLVVTITRSGSSVPIRQVVLVTVRRRPGVVRTDPPPRKVDVPLNSVIVIVFSTPIDPATLKGASLQLLQGTTPVAGTVGFGDPDHVTVVFTPTAPLAPRTPYRLVATTAIADLLGSTLAADVESDFTTGDATAATITSLTVVPDTVTVTTGNSVQFVAVARDASGATVPGTPVSWSSDAPSVATVSSGGLVTTHGPGRATITATGGGLVGSGRVTVSPTSISSITVSPDAATIALGDSIRLTAQARDAKRALIPGAPITWATNDVTIVTVDQNGLVKTLGPGIATVDAFGGPMAGPNYGSATITVTLASVASVKVTPDTATVAILSSIQLTAAVLNAQGVALSGAPVTWTSDAPSVATVDSSGLVNARGAGITIIRAVSGDKVGSARITVQSPPTPTGLVFASVSASYDHVCGLTRDGHAYCWGSNASGQLGDGTRNAAAAPVAVAGGLTFRSLSAGGSVTCGITSAGLAYCWGWNGYGQLGNGTGPDARTPVAVLVPGGTTFASISVGADAVCGLTPSGQAFCWGDNYYGQLGNGSAGPVSTAVPVAGGLTFVSVSAGPSYACGITITGTSYCWGSNYYGNFGTGGRTDSSTPVLAAAGMLMASLSTGSTTCGVEKTGTSYCWGLAYFPATAVPQRFYDYYDYPVDHFPAPVPLATSVTFASFSVAYPLACGLAPGGAAYCWGDNGSGQLGDGTTTSSLTGVVAVAGGLSFASLSVGTSFSCAATTAGVAYCWGDNAGGTLGTGTTIGSSVPVKVAGQP